MYPLKSRSDVAKCWIQNASKNRFKRKDEHIIDSSQLKMEILWTFTILGVYPPPSLAKFQKYGNFRVFRDNFGGILIFFEISIYM